MTESSPSPDDLLHDRIVSLIERGAGWLPFDEFMHEALYAPGLGYYSRPGRPIGFGAGDGSDFVTAPVMSPLFGRALARQVSEALDATNTSVVYEFGAGTGELAAQICSALSTSRSRQNWKYCIVELSSNLCSLQRQSLEGRFGDRISWLNCLPSTFEGVIVANEVLDAMPVKLLHFDGEKWSERGVGLGGARWQGGGPSGGIRFHWVDKATTLRPPYDHNQWVAGTVTEIHQQARAWISTIADRLRRGAVVLLDYGFGDTEYYHPQRLGGTLMCHQLHRADADPLADVGRKDITAHVNFTGIALAGQDAGLSVLGYTNQARFLFNCGLLSDMEQASVSERVMAQRLVLEHEMGELFKVLAFATSSDCFDAMGFREGDRSHKL